MAFSWGWEAPRACLAATEAVQRLGTLTNARGHHQLGSGPGPWLVSPQKQKSPLCSALAHRPLCPGWKGSHRAAPCPELGQGRLAQPAGIVTITCGEVMCEIETNGSGFNSPNFTTERCNAFSFCWNQREAILGGGKELVLGFSFLLFFLTKEFKGVPHVFKYLVISG